MAEHDQRGPDLTGVHAAEATIRRQSYEDIALALDIMERALQQLRRAVERLTKAEDEEEEAGRLFTQLNDVAQELLARAGADDPDDDEAA